MLTSTNAQAWNGDFTFQGTHNLNMGPGAVTLGGNRTVTLATVSKSLTVGAIGDGGAGYGLNSVGAGNLVINGACTYGGGTTVQGGGDGAAGHGGMTLDFSVSNPSSILPFGSAITLNGAALRAEQLVGRQ